MTGSAAQVDYQQATTAGLFGMLGGSSKDISNDNALAIYIYHMYLSISLSLSIPLSLSIYIYIYIYREITYI